MARRQKQQRQTSLLRALLALRTARSSALKADPDVGGLITGVVLTTGLWTYWSEKRKAERARRRMERQRDE